MFSGLQGLMFPLFHPKKKKKENKRVSFSGGQEHPELARGTEFSLGQQMCPLITSSSALPIRRRPLPASRQGVVSYLYPEVSLNFFFYSSHPIRPDRTLPVCFASRRTLPFVFVCFCAVSSFGSYLLHSLPLQPFAGEYATVIICRLRPIFGFGKKEKEKEENAHLEVWLCIFTTFCAGTFSYSDFFFVVSWWYCRDFQSQNTWQMISPLWQAYDWSGQVVFPNGRRMIFMIFAMLCLLVPIDDDDSQV